MAGKFKLIVKDYADLPVEIRKADIIIVATGAKTNPIQVIDPSRALCLFLTCQSQMWMTMYWIFLM